MSSVLPSTVLDTRPCLGNNNCNNNWVLTIGASWTLKRVIEECFLVILSVHEEMEQAFYFCFDLYGFLVVYSSVGGSGSLIRNAASVRLVVRRDITASLRGLSDLQS